MKVISARTTSSGGNPIAYPTPRRFFDPMTPEETRQGLTRFIAKFYESNIPRVPDYAVHQQISASGHPEAPNPSHPAKVDSRAVDASNLPAPPVLQPTSNLNPNHHQPPTAAPPAVSAPTPAPSPSPPVDFRALLYLSDPSASTQQTLRIPLIWDYLSLDDYRQNVHNEFAQCQNLQAARETMERRVLELYQRVLDLKNAPVDASKQTDPPKPVVFAADTHKLVQTLVPVTIQIEPVRPPVVARPNWKLELTDLIEVKPRIVPRLHLDTPREDDVQPGAPDENYKLAQSMFVVGEDRATPKQAAKVNLDLQPLEKEAEESPIPAPPESEESGNPTEQVGEQHTAVPAIPDTQAHQEMLEDNKRMAQFIQKMKERNKVLQTALETTQAKLDEQSRDLAATTQQKESCGQALEKLRAELNQRDQEANHHQETRKQLEAQISDLRTQLEDALKPRLSVPKSIKILPGRDMTPILLDELARTEGELDRVKQDYIRAIDDNQRQNALIDELGNQITVTNGIAERLIRLEHEHSAKIAQYERLKSEAISPDAYSALEQALRRSEANVHIKSEEIAALQYSQRKLEADLRERDGTINELTNTLQSIQTKKQDLLYELLETGEKNTRQDKEIQFERARWKEENRNLEFEIEKLRIELKTLLAKTVEHEADQAKLGELERQLQLAQTQKSELNEELSAKAGQLSTIQNQLTEQKIQISKLNYIKESHQALLTRASELESKLIDTEAARSVLKHEVAYLKQKEDTSQLLRESLLQRVKDAEEAHSKKLAEIDGLKKLLTEKDAEIIAVRQDLGLVGNKYEEMIKTVSKDANNPIAGTEASIVTDGFKSIKNSGTEAGDDLKSEVQLLKMRNSQLLLEIQKLKESLEQQQSASSPREVALKAAEAQITEMKRENTLLAKKLLEKSGEVKELKEKEAKLLQELQIHLTGQQEAGDLKQQISALNAEVSTLRQKSEEVARLQVLLSEKEGTLSSLRMSLAHQQSKMAALEQASKGSPMDSPTMVAAPGIDPQIRVLQSKLKAAQDRLAEQEEELSKALRRESSVKEEATLEQERLKGELTKMKTISTSSLGSSGNPGARELSEKLAELNDKYELAQAKLGMMDEIAEENERLRSKLATLEAKTQ